MPLINQLPTQPSGRSGTNAHSPMRLFVGVELSDKARSAVSGVIDWIVASGIQNNRLARPETVHLTLKFLGKVKSGQVDELVESLRAIAETRTMFALTLSGAGVFPNPKKARVLWLGISGDTEALGDLHLGIEDTMATLGFTRDRKPFNPHLTVARLRGTASQADRLLASETLASAVHPDVIEIPVCSITIVRSRLIDNNNTHERLTSLPLGQSKLTSRCLR